MAEAGEEPRAFGYLALERQRQAELQRLWSEFTIVRCDLSDEMKEQALRAAQKALKEHTMEKDVATAIKREFDSQKDQAASWHCVVGKHFAASITFAAKNVIYFHNKTHYFLLFRSED